LQSFVELAGQTTREVIQRFISNKKLQSYLLGQWLDGGVDVNSGSFVLHACICRGFPHEVTDVVKKKKIEKYYGYNEGPTVLPKLYFSER
jgi:hypothetical protein